MKNNESISKQLIEKASADIEFRNKILTDPKAAIKEATGIELPEGININIVEEKANEFFLVLPKADSPEGELSETELDAVAGGWSGASECGSCDPCRQFH